MSKLKHEAEQFKAALLAGIRYAEGRGAVQFEATDSAAPRHCMSTDCSCTTS